jgi:preprotein translocase subunit SecA
VITPGDFTLDEKSHQVYLTELGHEKAEKLLSDMGLLPAGASLYDPMHIGLCAPFIRWRYEPSIFTTAINIT